MSLITIKEQKRIKITFDATIVGVKKFVEVWETDFNGWEMDFITPDTGNKILVYLSKPEG